MVNWQGRLVVGLALSLVSVSCSGSTATSASSSTTTSTAPQSASTTDPTTPIGQPIHASDGLGDQLYPNLGNAGYDSQHVTLDLRLDTSSGRVAGDVTIEAEATQSLDSFTLDFDTLFVSEVVVDGATAPWTHEGGELRIDPSDTIAVGSTFVVQVLYGGLSEEYDSEAAVFNMGLRRSVDGFFVLSEPDGTSSWLPINDHPTDKATYDLAISVPGPLVAAASGQLVDVVQAEDGFWKYTFAISEPIAPYLLALGVGDFLTESEEGPGGVVIRNYYDSDLRQSTIAPFAVQAEMIEFLNERFGPYPFSTYGALVLQTESLPIALETQTLSTFGTQVLTLGEDVVIHELAHQWFGDSVSVSDWSDIWINEGFATYSQWLWTEHRDGPEFLALRAAQAYELISGAVFLTGSDSTSIAANQAYRQFPPAGSPRPDDLFNATVYQRGALTLHALRLEVGDEIFFEIARQYHSENAYADAGTEDFIATANEVAGRDLTGFIEAWLYDQAMPPIPAMGLRPLEG